MRLCESIGFSTVFFFFFCLRNKFIYSRNNKRNEFIRPGNITTVRNIGSRFTKRTAERVREPIIVAAENKTRGRSYDDATRAVNLGFTAVSPRTETSRRCLAKKKTKSVEPWRNGGGGHEDNI